MAVAAMTMNVAPAKLVLMASSVRRNSLSGRIEAPSRSVGAGGWRTKAPRLVSTRGDAEARRLLARRDREGYGSVARGLLALPGRNGRAASAPLGEVPRARRREREVGRNARKASDSLVSRDRERSPAIERS